MIRCYSFSNLLIDDIIDVEGNIHLLNYGGAGFHAVMGMRIWTRDVGIFASIGDNLPPEFFEYLDRLAICRNGLIHRTNYNTARAWQLYDRDGVRTLEPKYSKQAKPICCETSVN